MQIVFMKKYVILLWAMAVFSGLEAKGDSCGFSSAKVFSSLPQWLLPGEPVLLEQVSVRSRDVDLSFASVFGMISFNRSGTYKIVWYGQTRTSFYPSWTLGFSLDGNIILGNVYGPSDLCATSEKFEGAVVLSINKGQVLRFVNASPHPVELIPGKKGTPSPLPSFILSITLFEPVYPDLFYKERF